MPLAMLMLASFVLAFAVLFLIAVAASDTPSPETAPFDRLKGFIVFGLFFSSTGLALTTLILAYVRGGR
jgi:hypothetical protein